MGFGSLRFGFEFWGLGSGVRSSGVRSSGVWSSGVWGWSSGVWVLGYEVWQFGVWGFWDLGGGGKQSNFNNLLFTECSAGSSHDHCKSLSPCTIFSSGLPNPAQRLDAKARSTVYGHTYDC